MRGVRRGAVSQAQPDDRSRTALEFPPPALERVEAKAGSQAVSAALTLRGKLTFRNGPPFETHFVCLLDGQRKPLFFYALPALATRGRPRQ
jgi:hypothetical protein